MDSGLSFYLSMDFGDQTVNVTLLWQAPLPAEVSCSLSPHRDIWNRNLRGRNVNVLPMKTYVRLVQWHKPVIAVPGN